MIQDVSGLLWLFAATEVSTFSCYCKLKVTAEYFKLRTFMLLTSENICSLVEKSALCDWHLSGTWKIFGCVSGSIPQLSHLYDAV